MLRKIEALLEPAAHSKNAVDLLFRIATSLIFIIGGLGHFGQHQVMLSRMEQSPWRDVVAMMGSPSLLLWLSGAVFVVAGLALALGWMTRLSALALFAVLVPVTITVHLVPDTAHFGPLFKNIAILGALLYFWARGPGSFALDNFGESAND